MIVIMENFAATLEEVLAKTPVKHVVLTKMGDMLGGLKGSDRQLRRQVRQEAGAAL